MLCLNRSDELSRLVSSDHTALARTLLVYQQLMSQQKAALLDYLNGQDCPLFKRQTHAAIGEAADTAGPVKRPRLTLEDVAWLTAQGGDLPTTALHLELLEQEDCECSDFHELCRAVRQARFNVSDTSTGTHTALWHMYALRRTHTSTPSRLKYARTI
jgi:hypothetical protein